MKKIFFPIIAIASLTMSCTREEIQTPQTSVIEASIPAGVKTHLSSFADSCYKVLWDATDAISVNGQASSSIQVGTGSETAKFSFSSVLSSPYCAVYPASVVSGFAGNAASITLPATQAYTNGSFDPAAAVLVAKSNGNLNFGHAMSYFKIVPQIGSRHEGEKIASLVIKTAGEPVSGAFKVDFSGETPVVSAAETGSSDEVTVNCGVQGTKDSIIVAIPAQSYAAGMKLTLTDTEGHTYTGTSSKALDATPGKMYRTNVTFNPLITPEAPANVTVSHIGGTYARVSWDAVTDADVYNVYLGDTMVADSVTWKQFTLTGLTPSSAYTVKVSAVNAVAESGKTSLGFNTGAKADLEVAFDFTGNPGSFPTTYKGVNNALKTWTVGDKTYKFSLTSAWYSGISGVLSIWRSGTTTAERLGLPVVEGYSLSKVYVELPQRVGKEDSDLGVIVGGDTLNYAAPKVDFSKDCDNAASYDITDALPRQYSLYQQSSTGIVIKKIVLSYTLDERTEFDYSLDLSTNIFGVTATGVKNTPYTEYTSGFEFKTRGAKFVADGDSLLITYSSGYHGLSIPAVPGYKAKKIIATGASKNKSKYYGYITTEVSTSSGSKKVNVGGVSLYFNPEDRTAEGSDVYGSGKGDFDWEIDQDKVSANQELFFMVNYAILNKYTVTYVKE